MRRSLAAMRILFIFVAVAGCCFCPAPSYADSFLVFRAQSYIGKSANDLGLPARQWCADFVNMLLGGGTRSRRARDYANYGTKTKRGCVGCIAVMTRGKNGGHVGVVKGYDRGGNPKIISGNHNGVVGEGVYPRARVYAYVIPR